MKIAAVVVTYNRLNLLKECINAIRNQTHRVDDIIVVNNSSTDGTLEWLEEQKDLTVITQENLGGAGGFYTGIKTAYEKGYDWIWCMDDDAEPKKDALEELSLHSTGKDVVALGCSVVSPSGNIAINHRAKISLKQCFPSILVPLDSKEYQKRVVEIDAASFVGLFIKRDAIKNIGFPKIEFFINYDDIEYCIRLRSVGKILLIPSSVIVHKEAAKRWINKNFLGRESPRVEFHKFWLSYYIVRNFVWLGKRHSEDKTLFYFQMVKSMVRYIFGIVLYDDNKYRRLRLVLNAYADGLRGKFDNEKPKRILYKK